MSVDKIAVVGGSNGGYAASADLTMKGFSVRLYVNTPSNHTELLDTRRLTCVVSEHYRGPYREPGTSENVVLDTVTDKLPRAIRGADLVLVPLPTTIQEQIYPEVASLIESGQIVLLTPGNFGSYLLDREIRRQSSPPDDVIVAETPTLPYVTRKSGPSEVTINLDAVDLPVGSFPGTDSKRVHETVRNMYDSARESQDALDAALNNSNACVNATPTILNAGVIDNQEFPKFNIHRHGVTERVYEAIMALDRERVSLRDELEYGPPHFTQDQYYRASGDHFYGRESRAALHSAETFSKDPPSLDSRYVHEDIRVATVLLSSLGDFLSVPTPTVDALIHLAGKLMGQDFDSAGRTFGELGLESMERSEFQRLIEEGH